MLAGGSMEGKALWARNKKQKEVAAVADVSSSRASSTSMTAAGGGDHKELACAIIEELFNDESLSSNEDISCIALAGQILSTILDSSTMSTQIINCGLFWSYSNSSHVTMENCPPWIMLIVLWT